MAEAKEKKEKLVGKVTHYFSKLKVAVVKVGAGGLRAGDKVHIIGGEKDFRQTIKSMQVDFKPIKIAKTGKSVGVKVNKPVREGYRIYKQAR